MMWMMGYNDAVSDFDTVQDPYPSRKHRPLFPRPPCLSSIHTTDLLALNHHLAMAAEHNKRSSQVTNTQQVVVSSRWNPTPEQLQTLEDLYRSGTRTPSAEQIQHITGELRKYGKIEGKNVFYWFQNHKARERQKRRRQQLEPLSDDPQKKELPAGPNKTAFEVEQTKNWASPTNSSTLPEKTTGEEAECKAAEDDIDVAELQQLHRRDATWQMMNHLSYSSSSPSSSSAFSPPTTTTINNNNRHLIIPCSTSSITSPTITINHPPNPQLDHFVNFFTKPYTSYNLNNHQYHHHLSELGDSQTLQLFPLERGLSHPCDQEEEEEDDDDEVEDGEDIGDDHNDHVGPNYQFFEFLPLKN